MKIRTAAIIPDRSDRPLFLEHCLKMLQNQTIELDEIHVIKYPATSDKSDLTQRYRLGYEALSKSKKFDVIFFIENDDYYAPNYIETMLSAWGAHGKPKLFGTAYTIYYHIGERAFFKMIHPERASAMNTMIVPDLEINFPPDTEVYLDLHLWINNNHIAKKTFTPDKSISIGIKHGVGFCGGRHHKDKLQRFKMKGGLGNEEADGTDDANLEWLQTNTDSESFEFYKNFKA